MAAHSSVLAWRIPGKGAWWAAIFGVAQSRTRLKRLSNGACLKCKLALLQMCWIGISREERLGAVHV